VVGSLVSGVDSEFQDIGVREGFIAEGVVKDHALVSWAVPNTVKKRLSFFPEPVSKRNKIVVREVSFKSLPLHICARGMLLPARVVESIMNVVFFMDDIKIT
jgi:hypothetical protein